MIVCVLHEREHSSRGPVLGSFLQLFLPGCRRVGFSSLRGSHVLIGFLPLLSFGLIDSNPKAVEAM